MKVPATRVRAVCAEPEPQAVGWLIHGPEPTETDDLRARLSAALVAAAGVGAELTRFDPGEVRRDRAALSDALRAGSLFGGRPVVLLEGAGDGLGPAVAAALDGLERGEGVLVVTAGQLPASSKLRRLFEDAGALRAIAAYAQPMSAAEIRSALREAGASAGADEAATEALTTLARVMDPADLRGMLRVLGLYAWGETRPINLSDIEACRPGAAEGDLDAVVDAVAAHDVARAAAAFRKACARGVTAGTVAMGLGRRLRMLHHLATAADGAGAAIGRLRPPVFGPRRDALLREARQWTPGAVEAGLEAVLEAELALRSTGGAPEAAMVERLVIRLSMMRAR